MSSSIWFLSCPCVNVCILKHTSVSAKVYKRIFAPMVHPEPRMAIHPLPFLSVSRLMETNVRIGQPSHHPSVQTDTSVPHTTLPASQHQIKTLKWFRTWGTASAKAYVVIYSWRWLLLSFLHMLEVTTSRQFPRQLQSFMRTCVCIHTRGFERRPHKLL